MKTKIHLLGLVSIFLLLTLSLYSFKNKVIFQYSITISTGHTAVSCAGVGETCSFLCQGFPCRCHIPCWGEGNACQHTITIGLAPSGTPNIYNGSIDTQTDGFNGEVLNMPARSVLLVGGDFGGSYLNIPSQISAIVGYDPNNPPHIYSVTGLTITTTPLYSN